MCRWVAYMGSAIAPKELLHDPPRSQIEQSRRHAPNMAVPNGDGTGLGWYEHRDPQPAIPGARPGRDGNAGAADQLSPIPLPQLAVSAQRLCGQL
jgi:hypothetical protein